jgi:hypothetical protein
MAWFKTLTTNDTKDMYTLMNASNTMSDGLLMPVVLLSICMVWILGSVSSGKSIARSVLYSAFIGSILSILMVLMNWLSINYMYFAFFMTAAGLIWVWLSEAPS